LETPFLNCEAGLYCPAFFYRVTLLVTAARTGSIIPHSSRNLASAASRLASRRISRLFSRHRRFLASEGMSTPPLSSTAHAAPASPAYAGTTPGCWVKKVLD